MCAGMEDNMRIGIRAHDVKYAPLDELIPNIHNQGFHCMHIALSKSIKEFKHNDTWTCNVYQGIVC